MIKSMNYFTCFYRISFCFAILFIIYKNILTKCKVSFLRIVAGTKLMVSSVSEKVRTKFCLFSLIYCPAFTVDSRTGCLFEHLKTGFFSAVFNGLDERHLQACPNAFFYRLTTVAFGISVPFLFLVCTSTSTATYHELTA